tara:strand:- start:457 stop:789 length:333 start_codon:yes stop_codon:yes gene_type:complete
MSKNLDKLKGHSDIKQDINRRNGNGLNGKESIRLNKRINDIAKVISDPDVWNANIASRDRMDEMEQRLEEIEHRVNGMSYLVKRLVMNKKIEEQQLDILEEPTTISGSSE